MSRRPQYVAICPTSGQHLRPATTPEIDAYVAGNKNRQRTRASHAFDRAQRVGDVIIDWDNGTGGSSHTPGRFL